MPDEIATDRLLLRAPVHADAKAMQTLANNKNIHRFLSRLSYPYTHSHALDFINRIARREEEHSYAIINENSDFTGIVSLHLEKGEEMELGYWLGEDFWGKGYATEAAGSVLGAASKAGITKIIARTIEQNMGSIRVLQKIGFEKISTQIDDCGPHKGVKVSRLVWYAHP